MDMQVQFMIVYGYLLVMTEDCSLLQYMQQKVNKNADWLAPAGVRVLQIDKLKLSNRYIPP